MSGQRTLKISPKNYFSMDAPYWILLICALLVTAPPTIQVQAQDITEQIPNNVEATTSTCDLSSSFISKNAKIIIIVLSALNGLMIIGIISFSIFHFVGRRRQGDIPENIRESTRRGMDAIKWPLTTTYFSKAVGSESKRRKSSFTSLPPRQQTLLRSPRGMSKITAIPPISTENVFNPDELEFITVPERESKSYQTLESRWLHSQANTLNNPEPYQFDVVAGAGARSNNHNNHNRHKKSKSKSKRISKRQEFDGFHFDFDMERGIELGSNEHRKVRVSTASSYNTGGDLGLAFSRR